MSRKLQVKRGKEANLPTLAEGEFGFLTDKKKLYIGSDSGNVKISTGDAGLPVVNITSTDGIAYTGELPIEPYIGLTITVIPDKTMAIPKDSLNYPTLNGIEIMPSYLDDNSFAKATTVYIRYNKPLIITYTKNGNIYNSWKINGVGTYHAEDLIGTVPISKGGTGATTKEEAQANLGIPTSAADIGAATASDLANYLPLTGGMLSGNGIGLFNGKGAIQADENSTSMIASKDDNNQDILRVLNQNYNYYELAHAIQFIKKTNDSLKEYNIFGEHNTSLLASTIQKLIQNGGLSTLGSAIRIQNGIINADSSDTSTHTVQGTGKGKLFIIRNKSGSANLQITIDGKDIGTIYTDYDQGFVDIEFLKSFKISTSKTSTSFSYYLYYNAVFY